MVGGKRSKRHRKVLTDFAVIERHHYLQTSQNRSLIVAFADSLETFMLRTCKWDSLDQGSASSATGCP